MLPASINPGDMPGAHERAIPRRQSNLLNELVVDKGRGNLVLTEDTYGTGPATELRHQMLNHEPLTVGYREFMQDKDVRRK